MKLKLFKYRSHPGGRQIILIGKYSNYREIIRGICLLDINSNFNRTGSYSNWRADTFDKIDSVTLKGLHKSEVKFKRSTNGWITLGEYLICDDEILNIDGFLEDYEIPITELGLKPIDNLILRSKEYVG